MNESHVARVSSQLIRWLDDPFSVPKDQPHCEWCNSPKLKRKARCEVCGLYGSRTGPVREPSIGTFVEQYKPKKIVRVRKGWRGK